MPSFDAYKDMIEQLSIGELDTFAIRIQEDRSLDQDDKNQLMSLVAIRLGITKDSSKNGKPDKFWLDTSRYCLIDKEELPSYRNILKGKNYIDWLKQDFFTDYFHLPYEEIQKPLLITSCFLNSAVIPEDTPLGHFYFQSSQPESGKSTMMYFIGYHYPSSHCVYMAEDTPAGALRNIISSANEGHQPVLVQMDNFHPTETVKRLGHAYGRLLKYTRKESRIFSGLKEGGGVEEYNTFGLKIFTSIFSLDKRTIELANRCFRVYFEQCPKEKNLIPIESYDWSDLPEQYYKIWGDVEAINTDFAKLFSCSKKMRSRRMNNRRLQISRYPMAVGSYIGVWNDLTEAKNYFENYWEWVDTISPDTATEPLRYLVEKFVKEEHALQIERELKIFGEQESFLKPNEILYSKLLNYCSKALRVNDTLYTNKLISNYMLELGWAIATSDDREGRPRSIKFVKRS